MSVKPRVAVVMSRLSRHIDPHASWLDGLRAALRWIKAEHQTLVSVQGTAGCDVLCRAAFRLQIPCEILEFISSAGDSFDDSRIDPAALPAPDRQLLNSVSTILALRIRTNGNIHRGLRQALSAGKQVILIDLPDLHSIIVRDDLIARGASLWKPGACQSAPLDGATNCSIKEVAFPTTYEVVPFPPEDWCYLSHTTRACAGPWPRQELPDYLDSLLECSPDADHSAAATLQRIISQRRLIASGRTIRQGHEVVCLTAVPLQDLPRLRRFQTHRSRWDFEPFGLCINRKWLEGRGVRPVIYGTERSWSLLKESDRPFFQRVHDHETASPSQTAIDWSREREWRHVGDLNLDTLPQDQGLVFVPDSATLRRIARISPWPITILQETDSPKKLS